MPQYRRDPLTGRWVIVAEERALRPHQFEFETTGGDSPKSYCPFCPGNEQQTPNEIDVIRPADSPPNGSGWKVRVVSNQYPAVVANDNFPTRQSFQQCYGDILDVDTPLSVLGDPFYQPMPGVGTHEVIIDTPRHIHCVSELTELEVIDLFRIYKRRLNKLSHEKKYASAMIFKNVGIDAGASIPHLHSQLLAMPLVAPPIQRELHRAIAYRRETDRCYWCENIQLEIKNATRIVEQTDNFVSLCPYVSRFPCEVALFPKRHESHFERTTEPRLQELALLIRKTIILLCRVVTWRKSPLAYNIVLKSGPFVYQCPLDIRDMHDFATVWLDKIDYSFENVYHYHLSILPSLAKSAGFEWGCGLHINPISPESAAALLREKM